MWDAIRVLTVRCWGRRDRLNSLGFEVVPAMRVGVLILVVIAPLKSVRLVTAPVAVSYVVVAETSPQVEHGCEIDVFRVVPNKN